MPKWRKTTWTLASWNVLMILWLATAVGGVGPFSCAGETGAALAVCEAGVSIGRTLGLNFVLIVWLIGLVAIGLTWVATRPRTLPQ